MIKESVSKPDFEKIYEEYRSAALKLALSYTHNYDLAEDVIQDVFLNYYICIQFKGLICEDSFSWIETAVKHKASNYFRKLSREDLSDDMVEAIKDQGLMDGPEAMCLKQNQIEELICLANQILDELFKKNRQWYDLITDAYGKEVPETDIAQRWGTQVESIYSMAYRAKNWIRSQYETEYNMIKVK